MRKKHIILTGVLVAFTALALCVVLFSRHRRNDYARVLPDDCRWLVCVNLPELLSQADIDPSHIQALADMKAPQNCGLTLNLPVYFFSTPSERLCLLSALSDAERLEAWLTSQGVRVESQRGFRWADFRQWLLCFDGDKLLAMEVAGGQDGPARKELYRLMTTEHTSMPFADALRSVDGCVRIACSASALSQLATDAGKQLGGLPVPEGRQATLVAGCRVEPKSITLDASIYDPEHELDELTTICTRVLRPINAGKLDPMPDGALFSVGLNMDGNQLLQLLRKQKELRMLMVGVNLCMDADKILGSIDGDIVLSLADCSGSLPHFLLSAEVNDNSILSGASSWSGFGNMKVVGHSANACELSLDGERVMMQVKDNVLRVSNVASHDVERMKAPAAPLPENTYLVARLSCKHPALHLPALCTSALQHVQAVCHSGGISVTLSLDAPWTECINNIQNQQNPQ